MGAPRLSVVIAVKDSTENLDAILARLRAEELGGVEVLFSVAGALPPPLRGMPTELRAVEAEPQAMIPHLWRDGVLAARSDRVAFTTAEFLPPPGWIAHLLAADLDRWVAVGGPIEMGPDADAARWALFFLRYNAFAAPVAAGEVREVAADNAVYRRLEVVRHADLLQQGFWEPSFHERFRLAGMRLALDPDLVIAYCGHEPPRRFMAHRFVHGRAYGSARAAAAPGWRKALYLLASPAVPAVLLTRIVRRIARRPQYASRLPSALPWLVIFCLAWSLGEARGYLDALARRP